MPQSIRRHALPLVLSAFVALAFSWLADESLHHIFFARDLDRAARVASGEPIFFGPQLTGGGSLPGPLYYYLLAAAVRIGRALDCPPSRSAWLQLVLFLGAAVGLAFAKLRRWLGNEAAFVSVAFLLSLPWLSRITLELMNSSWLPFFVVTALLGLGSAFSLDDDRRRFGWFAACLSIAAGIQVHLSVLFLLPAGLVLQARARRLGLRLLQARDFFLGLGLFVLPLLPYFGWQLLSAFGRRIGQVPPPSSGSKLNVLATFWNTLLSFRDGWAGEGVTPAALILPGRLQSVSVATLLALGFVAILSGFAREGSRADERDTVPARLRTTWLVCTAFALLPIAGVFPYLNRARYFTLFYFSAALLLGALLRTRLGAEHERWRKVTCSVYLFPAVAAILTGLKLRSDLSPALLAVGVVCAVAAVVSGTLRGGVARNVVLTLGLALLACANVLGQLELGSFRPSGFTAAHLREAAYRIYDETGWTPATLATRLFLVDVHYETTPLLAYSETGGARSGKARALPDGYFLVNGEPLPFDDAHARAWLLRSPLESSVRAAIEARYVVLGEAIPYTGGFLVPYRVPDPTKFSRHFQNLGRPYEQGAPSATDLPGLLRIRDCPSGERSCEVLVRYRRAEGIISVRIEGAPIEAPSPWVAPDWTQGFVNPFLEIRCPTGGPRRLLLAGNLGYLAGSERSTRSTGTLLGPFERQFTDPCPGSGEPAFGYEKSVAFSEGKMVSSPAKSR